MSRVSLERGRRAEQVIARRLTRWTAERYRFARRGLGHRSVADLVVERWDLALPEWPFPISIKAAPRRAPGLHGLCVLAAHGTDAALAAIADAAPPRHPASWPWWTALPVAERARYWLIWKAHGSWWLSAAADNLVWQGGRWPAMLRLAGPGALLPEYTVPFDHLLAQGFVQAFNTWRQYL